MSRFITPLWLAGFTLLAAVGLDWCEGLTWYDQHRIEQIGLLSVVAFGGLTVWRQDLVAIIMRLPLWVRVAFVCFFGLGMLSVITASYPRLAALEWATLLLLLGLTLLLARHASQTSALFDVWAFRLVVALAVVIVLKIMAGYMAAMIVIKHLDSVMLFEGTFSNRRFFGQVASMLMPLLAYPLLRGGLSRSAQAALLLLLAVWWMLVIVSGTRGTWMALAVAAGVLMVVPCRAGVRWLGIQGGALGLGVLLYAGLFLWLPSWLGQNAAQESRWANLATLNGREVLWALAWVQIQAHPWLGIGPMHLAAIRNDFGAHPHNTILQLAAEWGLPALLALIVPVGVGVMRLLARLRGQAALPNFLLVCLAASLLAASAQSMVDGVIVTPYTQTLLALVSGWTLGMYFRTAVGPPTVPDTRLLQLGVPAISILALVMLLNGIFPEALHRAEVTRTYVEAGNLLVPPRYWAVGWIP